MQLAAHSLRASKRSQRRTRHRPSERAFTASEEAIEAEQAGASWCVAGNGFRDPESRGKAPARLEFVRAGGGVGRIPVIAIGGVKPEHVADLIDAGAYGVATIRGVGWDHSDRRVRTRKKVF